MDLFTSSGCNVGQDLLVGMGLIACSLAVHVQGVSLAYAHVVLCTLCRHSVGYVVT